MWEEIKAAEKSLKLLSLDWMDLYLIHWPEPGKRQDSWRALIDLRNRGLVRSIGVSNYMIRWALQRGIGAIPKSSRPKRIEENAAVFDFALDADEMARLDALDEGYRTCWDPSGVR